MIQMTDYPRAFNLHEVPSPDTRADDRFVCAFVIGYSQVDDDLALTRGGLDVTSAVTAGRDFAADGAWWYVHDRLITQGTYIEPLRGEIVLPAHPAPDGTRVAHHELHSWYLDVLPARAHRDGDDPSLALREINTVVSYVTTMSLDGLIIPEQNRVTLGPGAAEGDLAPQMYAAAVATERSLAPGATWCVADRTTGRTYREAV